MPKQSSKVSLRISQSLLDRVEALQQKMEQHPEYGLSGTVSRSDVLRQAILRGVRELEEELGDG